MILYRCYSWIMHYVVLNIMKLILSAATVIDILSYIGFTFAKRIASFFDITFLAESIGFKNGISPISSWNNLGMYLSVVFFALVMILPITIHSSLLEYKKSNKQEILRIRLRTGAILGRISDVSNLLLLSLPFSVYFHIVPVPIPWFVNWAFLLSLGLSLGIDNLSSSTDGEKYGMANLWAKSKAEEILEKEV